MFRELQRKNKQISYEECIDILKNEKRGVFSVLGDEGYPYGMPMNHYYCEEDGCIYFHCGKEGHRTDSLKKYEKASFCVYDSGEKIQGQWALSFRSVIVFGKTEIIEGTKSVSDICYKLSRKFTDDENYIKNEIDCFAENTALIKLVPEHICGKKITEA
ncbi:MAG: pyridoxamine 5'-phosphate oxidase family protein [Acutalibacteraceae bacterium]|nr:pyridoxamine 5'-phosphate oxidase family protein [Acutalibacteraceae bacterium]